MPIRFTILLAVLSALTLAPAAGAITCRQWGRLGPTERVGTVESMIQSTLASSAGRSTQVNRGAVERCLRREARSIEYAFDDVCSDSTRASMRAIENTFKEYIWSCI